MTSSRKSIRCQTWNDKHVAGHLKILPNNNMFYQIVFTRIISVNIKYDFLFIIDHTVGAMLIHWEVVPYSFYLEMVVVDVNENLIKISNEKKVNDIVVTQRCVIDYYFTLFFLLFSALKFAGLNLPHLKMYIRLRRWCIELQTILLHWSIVIYKQPFHRSKPSLWATE